MTPAVKQMNQGLVLFTNRPSRLPMVVDNPAPMAMSNAIHICISAVERQRDRGALRPHVLARNPPSSFAF